MQLSICSYSFHRLLAEGKCDIFRYIADCRELGCTQLDPWSAHLAPVLASVDELKKSNPDPVKVKLSDSDRQYLGKVKAAGDAVGLPFGCIAVDGAHIYEPTEQARRANRAAAYYWLAALAELRGTQIRIDAGGPPEMPPEAFAEIVKGYEDLTRRAAGLGIGVLIENHWGPSNNPDNLVKILKAVPALGLLFDTNNWAKGRQEEGWTKCAAFARATHVKTFFFDPQGLEPSVDIPKVMRMLIGAGFDGCWGIESCPKELDEYEGVRKTIALMRKVLGGACGCG
jgi:sugar phosphate isomerase/epimerase